METKAERLRFVSETPLTPSVIGWFSFTMVISYGLSVLELARVVVEVVTPNGSTEITEGRELLVVVVIVVVLNILTSCVLSALLAENGLGRIS